MHRIDTDGATVDGLFTNGNPAAGQEGTIGDADWLNDMQENVAQTIEGAGIPLVKGAFGQLLAAVREIASAAATAAATAAAAAIVPSYNISAKGHVEFAFGLLINWGNDVQVGNSGAQAVTFDKAFSAAPVVSFVSNGSGSSAPVAFHGTDAGTAIGMTVTSSIGPGSTPAQAGVAFRWFAFGHR